MADANIRINIEDASLGQLNEELDRLNEEIKAVPRNSKEFDKLSKSIRTLNGEVAKTEANFQAIDPAGFAGELGALGAAVGAVGVAFSSFGADSEELQESLEKVNAVIGLSAVAEQLANVARQESQVRIVAQTVATNAASAAQAAYATVVGTSTGALKLFRLALAATGIGLIIIAVGALVANWDKLTEAVKRNSEQLKLIGKVIVALIPGVNVLFFAISKLSDVVGGFENILPAVTGAFTAFFENIVEIGKSAGDIIAGLFTLDFDRIQAGIDQATNILKEGAKQGIKEAEEERRKQEEIEARKANQTQLDRNTRRLEIEKAGDKAIFDSKKVALQNQIKLLELEGKKQTDEYRDLQLDLLALTEEYNEKETEERVKKARERKQALVAAERELQNARNEVLDLNTAERIKVINQNLKTELENIRESSKSQEEIRLRSDAAELKALANKTKIYEEAQKKRLETAKSTYEAEIELAKTAAEAVGDTESLEKLDQKLAELGESYQAAVEQADETARQNISSLEANSEEQQRIIEQSLRSISQVTADVNEEIVKVGDNLRDEIISGALDQILDKNINLIKTSIEETDEEIIKLQQNLRRLQADEELYGVTQLTKRFNAAKASYEAEIDFIEQVAAKNSERIKDEKRLNAEAQRDLDKRFRLGLITQEEYNAESARLTKEKTQLEIDLEQNTTDKVLALRQLQINKAKENIEELAEVVNAALDTLSATISFTQERLNAVGIEYDEQARKATASYDAQIAAAERAGEDTTKIEEAKSRKLAQIELARAQREERLKISIANQNFALTVGQAVANGALAIIRTLAELGPIAGPIAAGFIGATTAFQIATARQAQQNAINQARNATAAASSNLSLSSGGGSVDSRQQFAEGGLVTGPGTGTSDSIPARLSDGEYVINAASTARFLPLLEQINSTPQRFANGGLATTGGMNNPDLNNLLERLERRLATPPKAYVVSSEIKEGLDSDQYLQRRASLT